MSADSDLGWYGPWLIRTSFWLIRTSLMSANSWLTRVTTQNDTNPNGCPGVFSRTASWKRDHVIKIARKSNPLSWKSDPLSWPGVGRGIQGTKIDFYKYLFHCYPLSVSCFFLEYTIWSMGSLSVLQIDHFLAACTDIVSLWFGLFRASLRWFSCQLSGFLHLQNRPWPPVGFVPVCWSRVQKSSAIRTIRKV